MGMSDFIRSLRSKVGTHPLLLPGVSGVVINDQNEILLVKAKTTGQWSPIGGMVEPGEEPADAMVREVEEETGVIAEPVRITRVHAGPDVTYSNGDRVHYLTIAFLLKPVGGHARVNDDESIEVKYFPLNALPEMKEFHRQNIAIALEGHEAARFETTLTRK